MLAVCGVSGTCSVTTSDRASSASSDRGLRAHCRAAAWSRCRRRPRSCRAARRARRSACRCGRSRRCPASCRAPRANAAAVLTQPPRCRIAFCSGMPRISMMISASTSSATLRVLENGALKTGMPRLHRRVQVDLVGADAEAADRRQLGRVRQHLGGQLGARADAEEVRVGDRVDQLGAGQRLGMGARCGCSRRAAAPRPPTGGCLRAAPLSGRSSVRTDRSVSGSSGVRLGVRRQLAATVGRLPKVTGCSNGAPSVAVGDSRSARV